MSTRTRAVALAFVVLLLAVAATSAIYGQNDSCRFTLPGDTIISSEWTGDCDSAVPGRGYARYFTFTMAESSEVTITLSSLDADTYLYLRTGNATSGDFLYENDDHEGSQSTSQIQETLAVDTYTIEATTYDAGEAGEFTLSVSGIPDLPEPTITPAPGREPLWQMIERVRPSVVKVVNLNEDKQGSGAIFQTEGMTGYVITNHHVVANTIEVEVTVRDVAIYHGEVIGIDEARDLAVVKFCCGDFQPAEFGDSINLNVADQVVVMGYPLDFAQPTAEKGPERVIVPGQATVTLGIVSAFRYDTENDREIIQTDAPINPGNSGGPLFTLDGLVVGVNTFIISSRYGAEGLGYAISETTVQSRLPSLMAGESPPTVEEVEPFEFWGHVDVPLAGHIHHDPDDGRYGFVDTGVVVDEGIYASAIFINPYSGEEHKFSYGLRFGRSDLDSLLFYIESTGKWRLDRWTPESGWEGVYEGEADNLRIGDYGRNHLSVLAIGDEVMFSLNGDHLATADGDTVMLLEPHDGRTWIQIINGPARESERSGAITNFHAFRAYEILLLSYINIQDVLSALENDRPDLPAPGDVADHHPEH